jgi:mannose-6-phosphate isomerase-like protein (cupin superfamily)
MKTFKSMDGATLKELFNPATEQMDLGYSFAHAELAPGEATKWHSLKYSEVYYILEGTALMSIDAETSPVSPGYCIYIPPKAKQKIENTGKTPMKFICIVDPAWRPECEVVDV